MRSTRTSTVPGTTEEKFDQAAIGRAIAYAHVARAVQCFGLDVVAGWMNQIGSVAGVRVVVVSPARTEPPRR